MQNRLLLVEGEMQWFESFSMQNRLLLVEVKSAVECVEMSVSKEKLEKSWEIQKSNMQLYQNGAPNPTASTKFHPKRPNKKNRNFEKHTKQSFDLFSRNKNSKIAATRWL